MSWSDADQQKRLWDSFMRYAQARPAVLDKIPDNAHVVLVPEYDMFFEHEGLYDIVRRIGAGRLLEHDRIAYVYLAFADYYIPSEIHLVQSVTKAHVEVAARRETLPLN